VSSKSSSFSRDPYHLKFKVETLGLCHEVKTAHFSANLQSNAISAVLHHRYLEHDPPLLNQNCKNRHE
jgi:hypothetical protein